MRRSTTTTGQRARPAIALFTVLLTLLILPTSVTGSGVALPHIGSDTGASLVALQWVVHAYNLTFASFMLSCGSLADLIGRRRVFALGAVLFTAASTVSTVSTEILVLDLARGVAGIGAAALLTSGSSILAGIFDGAARAKVFTAVGIVTGAGLALGAMAAGTLADALGWRSFFGAHALLMLPVLAAVPFLPESRRESAAGVDWAGAASLVGSLFLLMLGTVDGPQHGWASTRVLALLGGSTVLMTVFIALQRRRHPMLDLDLLRDRRFMALCLIPVVVSFAFVVLLPLLPNYLLVANGMSSQSAGATMLLMTLPILPTPALAGKLVRWGLSTMAVFAISLACLTAGVAWLAVVLAPGISLAVLAGPLVTLGVGLGLNFGLVDGAALTVVAPESTGTAAGLLNTLRLGSEAIVIAAAGSALVNLTQDAFGSRPLPGYQGDPTALANTVNSGELTVSAVPPDLRPRFVELVTHGLTSAWQTTLWTSAGICAVLSVAICVMLRSRATGTGDGERPGHEQCRRW
nr:MFS transporter [Kibdelosporangium sp. MJ126-NF4]